MKRWSVRAYAAVALLFGCWPTSAGAQTIAVVFHDGLVDLSTRDAPARAILAEWERVGSVRVVNRDAVPDEPMTLELRGVPEGDALDIVLRAATGYIAAPRPVATAGVSVIDRVMILRATRVNASIAPTAASDAQRRVETEMGVDAETDAILNRLGIPRELVAPAEGTDVAAQRLRALGVSPQSASEEPPPADAPTSSPGTASVVTGTSRPGTTSENQTRDPRRQPRE